MKKLLIALTIFTLAIPFSTVSARNVSVDEAKTAAAYYFSHYARRTVDATQLTLVHQSVNPVLGVPSCYYFNIEDGGWIIMSATTAADPVVAFNEQCNIDIDAMPSNARWWLESYNELLVATQNADAMRHFDDLDEWTALAEQNLPPLPKDAIHVLMNEEWEQGDNYAKDYNLYCPVIEGVRCPVGCVATALSQIFHYYRFPVKPRSTRISYTTRSYGLQLTIHTDSIRFDYSKMPIMISSTTTLEQAREISKLGYVVGVALNMDYGPDGSGAYTDDVPSVTKTYFKYNKGTIISRNGTGEDSVFVGKIRKELKRQRPVYMSGSSPTGTGQDAAGHAWVCCGYRDDRPARYYMNWGWGPSFNGWYNLQTNNMRIDQMNYNFIQNQRAILDLIPPTDSTHIDVMGIADVENTAELLPVYPNPATFSVTLPYRITDDANLMVYSIDGKLVESRRLSASDNAVTLNVSSLPAGIYIYRVGGASGKFMVQR